MKKSLIGIFICMLLILPATISASSIITINEENVDTEEVWYALGIFFGRICNLKEEMIYDEMHYTFDVVSMYGIEIVYAPLFEFHHQSYHETEGKALIPKDIFRGFIGDNLIVGFGVWRFE